MVTRFLARMISSASTTSASLSRHLNMYVFDVIIYSISYTDLCVLP